jgi:RNA polymerase-associated protein CTR9
MDDNDMEMEMGTPPLTTRTLEIEVGDQEVITIDLDALDQSTDDVIAVLQDAQCKVSVWTQLASEYWRRGWLESAQKITNAAVECKSYYKFDVRGRPADDTPSLKYSLQSDA